MAKQDKKKTTFKELHGKTKVGMFLRDKAPKLLEGILGIAGTIVPGASVAGSIIGQVNDMIDKSDELQTETEKEKAKTYFSILELELNDIANARSMYKESDHEMADSIANRIININIWVVMVAIAIEIACVVYLEDKTLIAIISAAIGAITQALLQERQQVINFFFGSSLGSKSKSKQMFNN